MADLAGDIAGRQLDRSKPLWEMWIVEGLADGHIGFIAKMHHSTVDGVSGAALLSVLFDLEPDPAARAASRPEVHRSTARVPSSARADEPGAAWPGPCRPFEMTRDIAPDRAAASSTSAGSARIPADRAPQAKAALPLSAPRTSFNGTLTRRRQVALTAIGLDDVKRLKNATGTTVNDVVLAVCTGALRTLPARRRRTSRQAAGGRGPGVGAARRRRTHGLQQGVVDVRPAARRTSTTRSSGCVAIHEGTKGAKEEHNALGADMLLNWAEHATPNVFASGRPALLAGCGWPTGTVRSPTWSSPTSPGPTSRSTWPAPSSRPGFPLGPVMDGMGVNITIMSYRGVLYWGIIACPEAIPRVWNLTAAIPLALDELLEAAGVAPAIYRSEDAAAAVRASGIEVDAPTT